MDDDELVKRFRATKDKLQVVQDDFSRLSAEIEHKLRLRPGNIQIEYGMQNIAQTDEALPSSSSNIQKRRRSDDDQNKLEAPSGAGRYHLVIRTDPVGRRDPKDDNKMIVFVNESLSIDVAMMDEQGNQVKARQAVKLVVLDSKKFRHDRNSYWTAKEFTDAVLDDLAPTNASFLLFEGQSLPTNYFTIKRSSRRNPVQLGVIAISDEGETLATIQGGVSNRFYVEIGRGGTLAFSEDEKAKRMDEHGNDPPVLQIGSGHHITVEDSQQQDAMEEDPKFAATLEELFMGEDPYKLGLEICERLPSILNKFRADSQTWRNLWAVGSNLLCIWKKLSELRAPPEERHLNTIDQLRQYRNILNEHTLLITNDQGLMTHQLEAKNWLQNALNRLLTLLVRKYDYVTTPTTREDQNENDTDYLLRNVTTDVILPRDEQAPGTVPPLNPPNPTASAGHTVNSHGASGYGASLADGRSGSGAISDIYPYIGAEFNLGDGYESFPFLHDRLQGYPSRNQHYNPSAADEKIPITTNVEPVVGYSHGVVVLAGPRPAYLHSLQGRRPPKTIDHHALYARTRRIGYYGTIGPFGGRLFRTGHQQVQDIAEINEMMGRLSIKKHPVDMMRKKEVVWMMSQQAAAPANEHQKFHEVEAESSMGANKQQEASCARCGSTKYHGESIDRQFVVLDLQATCLSPFGKVLQARCPSSRKFQPEIIEFSSVLVDAATGDIKSIFHTYVRPIKHEKLNRFTMACNGISQEDVEGEDALMLSEALWAHTKWLVISQEDDVQGKHAVILYQGMEEHIKWLEDNVCLVVTTWGAWDCRTLLRKQCERNEMHVPDYLSRWMNLKRPFMKTYDIQWPDHIDREEITIDKLMVQDAVVIARLGWKGDTEKGGRSNARNKARLLKLLILAGANLRVTSWLDQTKGKTPC